MTRWHRFLCWIGLHKWVEVEWLNAVYSRYACQRCNKRVVREQGW